MLEVTYQNLNEYRLAWINPQLPDVQYGTFLFNEPKEAKTPIALLKAVYPDFVIWVEDHEHNLVVV